MMVDLFIGMPPPLKVSAVMDLGKVMVKERERGYF